MVGRHRRGARVGLAVVREHRPAQNRIVPLGGTTDARVALFFASMPRVSTELARLARRPVDGAIGEVGQRVKRMGDED